MLNVKISRQRLVRFGEISRKSVNSAYVINLLKVDVFLSESNARFYRPSIKPRTHGIPEHPKFTIIMRKIYKLAKGLTT